MPRTKQMVLGEIRLPVFDSKSSRWVVAYRRGRVFEIEGKTLELFPIQVLAETIGHSVQSIKRWERLKQFPAPMFKIPVIPKRSTRFYSKTQIANIRAVFDKYPKRTQVREFCKNVWTVFYLLEMTPEALRGEVQ